MKTLTDGRAAEDRDSAPHPFFHEGMRAWQDLTAEGAQLVVRVRVSHVYPDCPRYIHRMPVAH